MGEISIQAMTDQEKSGLLVGAMGWTYLAIDGDMYNLLDGEGHPIAGSSTLPFHNLYNSEHMALAWRVLNWALDQGEYRQEWHGYLGDALYSILENWETMLRQPPADAQRLWLDKILELVIKVESEE